MRRMAHYCLEIGWQKDQLDGLEKIWWEHHDKKGNLMPRSLSLHAVESKSEGWISVKERLPEENVSVLVFIPEEDNHVTTGMWDVSKKWVLLDEYRVPKAEVTYWRAMVELPEDKTYTKSPDHDPEEDTMSYQIRALQKKVFDLESGRKPLPPK